jgi:hypothetical protein
MAQRITNDFAGSIVGSVFTKASSDAIIPPTGHVFIGFTVLSAATFDATGGLVAYTATQFANTEDAAGDLAAGSETNLEGSGGVEIGASDSFPAGATIYGKYTEIDLAGGSIIAYYAKI